MAGFRPLIGVLILALGLAATALAAESFFARRAARFGTVHSATANFTQEREVSLVAEVLRASGNLTLKAPDTLRLELTAPQRMTLVAAGGTVAVLDADGEPLQLPPEITGAARFARQLTDLLLGSKGPEHFDESWRGADFVVLTARHAANPYVEITLGFPPSGPLPEEIVLRERAGDRTTIRLSDIRLNPRLEETSFEVAPSEGPAR